MRVDHVGVRVALVRLRSGGAGLLCLFFGVLDLLSLTFMLHRLRHGVPSTTRCCWVPLLRVGGIVTVFGRGDRLTASVGCLASCTGYPACDFVRCPMVLVPFDDWNPLVIPNLPDLTLAIELPRRWTHSLCGVNISSHPLARWPSRPSEARSCAHEQPSKSATSQ